MKMRTVLGCADKFMFFIYILICISYVRVFMHLHFSQYLMLSADIRPVKWFLSSSCTRTGK